ncbi:MAG: pyrroline-5-carboxylate reductase [Chloroflexi bacterium]|nr:pyrroline-5-carboxylate reductase [Chloroflexota bacterium]
MFDDRPIAFIGPGVMAEAMVASLTERGELPGERVMMSGPRPHRLERLHEKYGAMTTTENRKAVEGASVVVLTVKPQSLAEVLDDLQSNIPQQALVVSIVAGANLSTIADGLKHPAIVRAMPNTPGQVGAGITVWTKTSAVTDGQSEHAVDLLRALGKEIEVEEEDYLNMATALSGTGPTYVFLFMEAMIDAGVHMGFPRRIAEELVLETIRGSLIFYEHSASHPARLRNQVTSPGGTSAEAIYYLEKAGFRTGLARAIWAAYERSVELGEGKKRGLNSS